jgi:hypothetical protein
MRKTLSTLLATSAVVLAAAAGAQAATPALHVAYAAPTTTAAGDHPIIVRVSTVLPTTVPKSEMPHLSPALAGHWSHEGKTLRFTPDSAYSEGSKVIVTVPAALAGANGAKLKKPYQFSYTVGSYDPVRLAQLLAQLGYLPVTFHAAKGATVPKLSNRLAQMQAAYAPPRGTLVLGKGWPSELTDLWEDDRPMVIAGAIRAFESQNDMSMDGVAGPDVWSALVADAVAGKHNTAGYTYAVASEGSPETLTVWHNGQDVLHTLANTGVAGAETEQGTYPVYEKLSSQVMQGTNLDGSTYADQVYWVSYFHGGDAVHYFDRASYGYPQSLGCVELPYDQAKTSFGYLSYGSLVTVD